MRVSNGITMLLLAAIFITCTAKKSETTATASDEWPEMDAFHMRMAEVYHPYKDSANLRPAKEMADLLAADADKWAASKLPAKVDNDEVKSALKRLTADTKNFAELVQAMTTDAALGKKLTEIHEEFHAIMERYHGEGKH